MSVLLHKFYRSQNTVSGGLTFTTDNFGGIMMHLIVRAKTASTIFDLTIKDHESGFAIYQRESVDGEVNDLIQMPVDGTYDVYIANATQDEQFRFYMVVREI